jgi:hypothetical protein
MIPRRSASPFSSLRTMYGKSTSKGPRKSSSVSAAERRVAHSHGCERTNRAPSRMSSSTDAPESSRATGSGRMNATQAVETAKVAASAAKAAPGPRPATSTPPSAGPRKRNATGSASCCSEFASTSRL